MTSPLLLLGLLLWIGSTLLLSQVRRVNRIGLVERLGPYSPGGTSPRGRPAGRTLSCATLVSLARPACLLVAERMARVLPFGRDDVATRLERIHSPLDVGTFRMRQLATTLAAFGVAAVIVSLVQPPAPLALMMTLGVAVAGFVGADRRLSAASVRWQRRLVLELPVVAEQLAMLSAAGFSLGSAITRLADRGQGNAARDLARVARRIRHGLCEVDALKEWAALADVEALDRLTAVLALSGQTGDLGRLLSNEARSIRRQLQRDLVEMAERRSQQVWIPVTVAALVPGMAFLAVPFVDALRFFSAP